MLSRVADSLYWMSRYLERAEHTSRLLEVNINLMLEHSGVAPAVRWSRVGSSLGMTGLAELDTHESVQTMTSDLNERSSIVSCIVAARDNARQVREQISSEMWEQLNRLYHHVRRVGIEDIWDAEPMELLRQVRDGAHLFQGITDSTMNHGDGWQFIQVGRYIERALSLATLLDVHFAQVPDDEGRQDTHIEWLGLLKSATAFEGYCKVYTADLTPDRIAEFLMLSEEFPHSIRFAVDQLRTALNSIAEASTSRKTDRLARLSGRLVAALSYSQIEEIMSGGLHTYLESVRRQCAQIHTAVNQVYITYAIESALEA
jgi:uncharacterized alpha-E superfamily protein